MACPCADACSDAAWKRAQVWGWTAEEARARLAQHLQTSSLHGCERDNAEAIAETTELLQDEYEVDEKEPKKRKTKSGGKGESGGKSDTGGEDIPLTVSSLSRLMQSAATSSASSTGGICIEGGGVTVTVRRERLRELIDSCNRAHTAAKAAARRSAAAAQSFNNEAQVTNEVKGHLDGLLSSI